MENLLALFRYLRGFNPAAAGGWLIFFAAFGPICIGETLLLSPLRKRGLAPPSWISIPFTVLAGIYWGHLFFFPPAINSGLKDDVINALAEISHITVGMQSRNHGMEL
jgi:hypothetical protein